MKKLALLTILLINNLGFSQKSEIIKIVGTVYDEYLEPFPNAIIKTPEGRTTTTNYEGVFNIKTKIPTKITISASGYENEKVNITNLDEEISVVLKENSNIEQIVLSASRIPERLFESPVSIGRISLNSIKETPSITFYESLENLVNVDVKTNSILLKSVNTKGFSTLNNIRFIQLIDGMDNVYPTAGFSPGNMVGLVDMDVENVEILNGASSALYGAGAFNGVMLIQSKNPFDYTGISAKFQGGVTEQNSQFKEFYSPSVRLAYKFNDALAAKVSFSYYTGEEWEETDNRNIVKGVVQKNSRGRKDGEAYDGVNTYGDEFSFNKQTFPFLLYLEQAFKGTDPAATQQAFAMLKVYDSKFVSRDGYDYRNLTDGKANNIKFNTSLHYRPFNNNKLEFIYTSRFNNSTNLMNYGSLKVQIKDAQINQHKLEVKGENFFVRSYISSSNIGDSYDLVATGALLNEQWKPTNQWIPDYLGAYAQAALPLNYGGLGLDKKSSSKYGRDFANKGRLEPGTSEFSTALNQIRTTNARIGGSSFMDESKIYNIEGNYNFGKYLDAVEIQVGGAYKRVALNTKGYLMDGKLNVIDYGLYTQFRKKLINDRLNITVSTRFDKSQNFNGAFSPRLALGYTTGEKKNHNIRFSIQKAYRSPNIEEQFAQTNGGNGRYTIGSTEDNYNSFKKETIASDGTITTVDKDFLRNTTGFTKESFDKLSNTFIKGTSSSDELVDILTKVSVLNPLLQIEKIQNKMRPEQVLSFETGYRSMIDLTPTEILEVEVSAYFNKHTDFIRWSRTYIPGNMDSGFVQPDAGGELSDPNKPVTLSNFMTNPFNVAVLSVFTGNKVEINARNTEADIFAYGGSFSVGTRLINNYKIALNYAWNDYRINNNGDSHYLPDFNTSKHNIKVMFGNKNVFSNIGFNIVSRWQSGYYWQAHLMSGDVDARTVIDAQLTYYVPQMKSKFRFGATNLSGKEYYDNIGNGGIGRIWNFSWIIND